MQITYFDTLPTDLRERDQRGAPISPTVQWGFHEKAPQTKVSLPTDAVRVRQGHCEHRGEIVALGTLELIYKLLPQSPEVELYGAEAILRAAYSQVSLDVDATVVRPSSAWIDRYCGESARRRHSSECTLARRRALLSETPDSWVEVGAVWPNWLASLVVFHRFENPHHGTLVHTLDIDMLARWDDLQIVSGPSLAERFSLPRAIDLAAKACAVQRESGAAVRTRGMPSL